MPVCLPFMENTVYHVHVCLSELNDIETPDGQEGSSVTTPSVIAVMVTTVRKVRRRTVKDGDFLDP